ncbi:hypothetical protein QYE76_000436 [Lolium multiflorum]|uniref:Ubiquitin-like domain-containing protein n=1 Tax=Lolium multiflorum TaxID=4521 RepID=A0AAD8RHJ0_LOLMU|nr:hypothetical protein QYE76_000436 [Lolium multiflorum]
MLTGTVAAAMGIKVMGWRPRAGHRDEALRARSGDGEGARVEAAAHGRKTSAGGDVVDAMDTIDQLAACRSSERMQIFVHPVGWVHGKGNSVALGVESSDTVDDAMAKIQDRIGLPTDQHRLFYGGMLLVEVQGYRFTLADYNITDGSRLELLVPDGWWPLD